MKTILSVLVAVGLWGAFGGDAFATISDGFDYPANSPVPAPWVWAVSGTSSNQVEWDSVMGNRWLRTRYAGSGWWTLTRNDVALSYLPGGGAIYSILFFDDGTLDLGILFYVSGPGGWAGIGVNNNVANGQYYFRTDANNGNTGVVIPARRDGAHAKNDWHLFQIFVRDDGAYPMVDGIPISNRYRYPPLTSATSVQLMANWSKPANYAYFDNFRVDLQAPCPYLTCQNLQIVSHGSIYGSNLPTLQQIPRFVDNEVQPHLTGWAATYYTATSADLGNPAPGQAKDLVINYECGSLLTRYFRSYAYLGAEAVNKTTSLLDCTNMGPAHYGHINVISAIYGANVGANFNVLDESGSTPYRSSGVRTACDGFGVCDYFVEYLLWGPDPAPGQAKDLTVLYTCSESSGVVRVYIPAEANHHGFRLSCR